MIARQTFTTRDSGSRPRTEAARVERKREGTVMRMKGWGATAAFVAIGAAYFVAYANAQAQADAKAASVMADLRKALGGEQKIAALKALSLRADYRREIGAMSGAGGGGQMIMIMGPGGSGGGAQLTGKLEIDLELPERYLRADIGTGLMTMTRTEGFEGARPFSDVAANSPGMRVMTDSPSADPARTKAALRRHNAELARLLLGVVGTTHASFPVSYAYGGIAESPDGEAHVIDVSGPDDFKVRLYVDTESNLPLMLSYLDAEPRIVTRSMTRDGGSGPGGHGAAPVVTGGGGHVQVSRGAQARELTPEQQAEIDKARKEAEATPAKMVEYRLFFSDYRKVDGLSMPHRIARGTGNKTTEEWDVTSYKVNPTFKADRFKVGS
jgi:hypothetical protein